MSDLLIEPINDLLLGMNINNDGQQDQMSNHQMDENNLISSSPTNSSQSQEKIDLEQKLPTNRSNSPKIDANIELEADIQLNENNNNITSNNSFQYLNDEIQLDQKKLEENIKITQFLDDAYKFGANAIDLSKRGLEIIPKYMNKLDNLQVFKAFSTA